MCLRSITIEQFSAKLLAGPLNHVCLQDKEPKGIIPLENIQVREVAADRGKPNCFELYSASNDVIKACKTDSEGKVIEGQCCYKYIRRCLV